MLKSMIAAVGLSLAATVVHAVEINPINGYPNSIMVSGDINLGDEDKLFNVLKYRYAKKLDTKYIVLNSAGGSTLPAYRMALLINKAGIITVVDQNAECASSCVLLWAAGVERYYWGSSRIGVHSVSIEGGQENGSTMASTTEMARVLKELGAPPSVVGKLVTTGPDDIAWLSPQDMSGWAQSVESVQAAAQAQTTTETSYASPSSSSPFIMTCVSANRSQYQVTLRKTDIVVRDKVYPVNNRYDAAEEAGAYVAIGPTKYGKYAAIFGGPNPRMMFENTKGEQAVDQCR
jgi:hypothetical protein